MAEEKKFASKIVKALDGERIDKALCFLFNDFSRRELRKLIEKGSVYLNNKRCLKLSKTVKEGDIVEIVFCEEKREAQQNYIEILFDQFGFIAINKPPFLPSVPSKSNINSAQNYVSKIKKLNIKEIHPVNRLDTPVSGVILFAYKIDSARKIETLKIENKIEKVYYAYVIGIPFQKEGRLDFPLSQRNGSAFVDERGRESTTYFKVLKSFKDFSLLEVKPITGRMHQIRVHLKEYGFPIVGDRKYGKPPYQTERPLLHCSKLSFVFNDKKIEIAAKIPDDFASFEKEIEG